MNETVTSNFLSIYKMATYKTTVGPGGKYLKHAMKRLHLREKKNALWRTLAVKSLAKMTFLVHVYFFGISTIVNIGFCSKHEVSYLFRGNPKIQMFKMHSILVN